MHNLRAADKLNLKHSIMDSYQRLLSANKLWATEKVKAEPEYFNKLINVQTPEFLWIGCADSRVPADQLTGTQPGEIFVHRNIANMVVHTDTNLMSVLQYAVEVLKVKHVLVVGHYHCGGVKAAMGHQDLGLMNKWIRNIKEVYEKHEAELDTITEKELKFDRMVELNVQEQVYNLVKTSIIQNEWAKNQFPHLHGWVYDLHNGLIKPIVEINPNEFPINQIYRYV